MNEPLAGLRDYHLPPALPWWPPAPGWWWLSGLALAVLCAWLLLRWLRSRRAAPHRLALKELRALRRRYRRRGDGAELVRGVSRLLRRYALVRFAEAEVAGLAGRRWISFLDRHGSGKALADGAGRALVDAPYQADPAVAGDELVDQAEAWILANRRSHR